LSLTLREEKKLSAFKNVAMRITIGPHRYDVEGDWRKLHNEGLHDLYFSPNFTMVIKSRRMRCAGQVAPIGETKMHTENWWSKLTERHQSENIDGSIITKWIFQKYCGRRRLDGYGLECGKLAGF